MSNNKKQPQYIGKPAVPVDAGSSVPPRYQPPPQPLQQQPGILKHGPALSQPSQPPKDVKQHPFAAQHAKTVPVDVLKQPPPQQQQQQQQQQQPQLPYPSEGTKFYPHGPVPNLKPGYQGQIFSPQHVAAVGINPNQAGIARPHRAPPAEEDLRSNSALHQRQPQRVFEEAHGPVPHLTATRPHQEEFFRGVTHQRSQEELAQIPGQLNSHRPTHEEFVGVRGPIQHRPPPQRFSDEELLRLGPVDMLKFVRKSEGESARIASEQHRHMQALIQELRALKEANQRLGDDNQELRDLCCFLDDDRQKGRKLAREWQRFGRYTASVMRQEVSAYQNKLRELDNKQQELIKDNLELKELCLYLDEERGGSSVCPSCGSAASGGLRDDGDGSSSSTNADEPAVPTQFNSAPVGNAPRRSASRERLLHESLARQRSTFNDQTMQYVRNLEQRVKQLEDEKRILQHKMSQLAAANGGDISDPTLVTTPGNGVVDATVATSGAPVLSGRPEAVVRALQVLEVREQLERNGRVTADRDRASTMIANNVAVDRVIAVNGDNNVDGTINSDMDDGEKALVREMCNVVWRKLEETPPARR